MKATSRSGFLRVHPELLVQALQAKQDIKQLVVEYACEFHKRLINSHPPLAAWPTDLEAHGTDWQELIPALPIDMQLKVSLHALGRLKMNTFRGRISGSGIDRKLENEIFSGKSVLVLDKFHEAYRVVSVVAVQIVHADGRILAQLGKFEYGLLQADCTLPGTKQFPGETLSDTVDRILESRFPALCGRLHLDSVERSIDEYQSSSLKIRTRYCRKVVQMRLEGERELDVPTCSVMQPFPEMCRRRPSTATVSSIVFGSPDIELEEDLKQQPVFAIPTTKASSGGFYTWLDPHAFQKLSEGCNESKVSTWLKRLGLPPSGQSEIVIQAMPGSQVIPLV